MDAPDSLASAPDPIESLGSLSPVSGTTAPKEFLEAPAAALPAAGSLRWVLFLLASIFFFIAAAEVLTVHVLPRVNKNERRVREEYLSALQVRQGRAAGQIQVLIVGNSLLVQAVDLAQMNAALSPGIHVRRFALEGPSTYYDWYYGLKRLFHEGARPDVVALFLTARHLSSSGVRGEYFAQRLMRTVDILRLARELHLDPTSTSNRLFASLSMFYSSREEIRPWLLSRIIPGYHQLLELLLPAWGRLSETDLEKIPDRLRSMQQLTASYNVRLLFVLPPEIREDLIREDRMANLDAASAASGVPLLVALPPTGLAPEDFKEDFYHMNEVGAVKYSKALAPLIRTAIAHLYEGERR